MPITEETITFTCPSCGHTSRRRGVIKDLSEGKKPLCDKCGKEIPIDHEKIRRAQHALAGLSGVAGEGGTIDTPEGPVVVTSKTFNVDIKREIDDGKAALAGGAVPTSGASRPNAIGPKRGCFGVLATLTVTLAVAAALVCALA